MTDTRTGKGASDAAKLKTLRRVLTEMRCVADALYMNLKSTAVWNPQGFNKDSLAQLFQRFKDAAMQSASAEALLGSLVDMQESLSTEQLAERCLGKIVRRLRSEEAPPIVNIADREMNRLAKEICEKEFSTVAQQQPTGARWTPEKLAERFHELYEHLAPKFGYETRKASAKPWAEVPENNRKLMTTVCEHILKELDAALASGSSEAVALPLLERQVYEIWMVTAAEEPPHQSDEFWGKFTERLNRVAQPKPEAVAQAEFLRGLEVASQHMAGDYNGGDYDWACTCGTKGHYGTWANHIWSLAAAQQPAERCKLCGCAGTRSTGACTCNCHRGISDIPGQQPAEFPTQQNHAQGCIFWTSLGGKECNCRLWRVGPAEPRVSPARNCQQL
jgi:hypothetical protein